MRRSTAALSALALAALALTGCTTTADAGCERADSSALGVSVKVSGALGTPEAELDTPVRTAKTAYTDAIVGDGPAITAEGQNAIVTRVLYNGATGDMVDGATSVWSPESMAAQLPGMDEALECATEGSRVIVSVPAKDLPEGTAEQIGLGKGDSLIGVLDVRYILRTQAEGRDIFNDARGLPSVVRAADGRPGIIIPDAAAPKKVASQTLIEGDGEKVGDGVPMFNFTAVSWATREVTGSTWDQGVSFDPSALPEEVRKAVSKATVGSQILVVVPGGDSDATAYVVDILGLVPKELTQG